MADKSLEAVLDNVTKPSAPTVAKTKKLSSHAMRERDNKLIRGKFHFHESPGSMLAFVYQEHKDDQIRRYALVDGQIYTLPYGVARHINKNVAYPIYEHYKGGNGTSQPETYGGGGFNPEGTQDMRIKHMKKRASFESLEFIADPDFDSGPLIETVEFLPIK